MTTQQSPVGTQFKHLFSPLDIGSISVRNRILSTAHYTGYAEHGLPSLRHRDYWASKAKGGIGLIITEVQPVHWSAGSSPTMIQTYRDEVIEAFRPIVDAVHEHGARIIAQLWHPGRSGGVGQDGHPAWAVSADAPSAAAGYPPHEMTVPEIQEVVQAFGDAARRMQLAGLDGVELHGAHGYLIQEFMSPLSNLRSDEYGGSEENRLRFAREVMDATREAVGPDFTVGMRINGDQFQTGGLTLEDMKRIMATLTESGQLDYVNVSFSGAGGAVIAPMYVPAGQFVYLAAGIKEVTDLPVFCIGRINDPVLAESILEQHQADIVGMTRANICDPELPNKAREGRLDEIRRCIACNEGCWGHVSAQLPITCAINPSVGREQASAIRPAEVRRRVMVIGGGIAGMEAARVAAERGHEVSLYEAGAQLGGQLQIAAKAPGRGDLAEPVRWYEHQFERLGVKVYLERRVDADLVRSEAPDAVIVATGGLPKDAPWANGNGSVLQARDVLAGAVETGDRVVVVAADQGMEGLTTADFLASRGKHVEVIVPQTAPGARVEPITSMMILGRLARQDVAISTMTQVRSIEDGAIVVGNVFGGGDRRIEDVDSVVVALGSRANDAIFRELDGAVGEVLLAGECYAPRKLEHSTYDGLRAGLAV